MFVFVIKWFSVTCYERSGFREREGNDLISLKRKGQKKVPLFDSLCGSKTTTTIARKLFVSESQSALLEHEFELFLHSIHAHVL